MNQAANQTTNQTTSAVKPGRREIVVVEKLVTQYGDKVILKGIDLCIEEGEIRVIMGGSGSGKSTLLWHIVGLYEPTAGRVLVMGKDIHRISFLEKLELLWKIGVSFQNGALFSDMTVGENVALPLREFTDLDEKTIQIIVRMKLEVVNLGGYEDYYPSQLSGGMVKRAALARAIVRDPALLLFDEPSAGLDPILAAELDELILQLRKAMGMTMIVVTHDLDSAFTIADKITFLHDGKILMTGTPEEVKNADNPIIQAMIQRKPLNASVDPEKYLQRLTRALSGQ